MPDANHQWFSVERHGPWDLTRVENKGLEDPSLTALSGTDLLEVPNMYTAYYGLYKADVREYSRKYGQKYGTNVPPFWDPEFPIDIWNGPIGNQNMITSGM